MAKKLPAYTLQQTKDHSHVVIRAVSKLAKYKAPDRMSDWMDGHKSVPGEIGSVEVFQYGDKVATAVGQIRVREELRRSGLGTKLYEAAARVACTEFNQPLSSDHKRSLPAQRFWEKQVKRKRAVCARKGRLAAEDRDAHPARSVPNRGGCDYYRLKSCPAPVSLTGKRRLAK